MVVPPGARVKRQMTKPKVKRTNEVENLLIHVERAINQIKFFRILKGTISITMIHHADDKMVPCLALCNLKPKLIKTKEKDFQK